MFARIKKNTNTHKRSVLVCRNVRFGNKVRQQTIKVFGHSSDPQECQAWFAEAKNWIAKHGEKWLEQHSTSTIKKRMRHKVTITNLEEESRINVGIEDVFGKLYKEIGFHSLLSKTHQETLRQIVFARLLEPSSKRRLSILSEKKFNKEIPLDRIYRMMDKLIKESPSIENKVFTDLKMNFRSKIVGILQSIKVKSISLKTKDIND